MKRKQSIITGATSGIGKETAIGLAHAGFDVLILARDQSKASLLVEELKQLQPQGKFQSIQCDFSSLKSVDAAAHIALDRLNHLDVLINNAGAIYQDRQESVDGIELTLAVNHLGPYHLTERLIPLMEQSKRARIINVSSAAHTQAKLDWDDLQLKKGWSALKSYANSKLFNIYTARHWADKLRAKGITAYSLHPGVVKTGFAGNFKGFLKILLQLIQPFMITSKQGASTSIYLATDASVADHSGKYFAKRRIAQPAEIAMNTSHQLRLIEESQKLIQQIL